MVDSSLHLTRELAILHINGNEIIVKSRLPKYSCGTPLRAFKFAAYMMRFIHRIHQHLPASDDFIVVTGDEFMLNNYAFYMNRLKLSQEVTHG